MDKLIENDWNHMHDCVLNVSSKSSSREELVQIFSKMPDEMKNDAHKWGMSDTLWRDKFIEWYEDNGQK